MASDLDLSPFVLPNNVFSFQSNKLIDFEDNQLHNLQNRDFSFEPLIQENRNLTDKTVSICNSIHEVPEIIEYNVSSYIEPSCQEIMHDHPETEKKAVIDVKFEKHRKMESEILTR